MSGSSGGKQITRYGVESAPNTIATTWKVLPFTTNGLDETPSTTESATIRDSRIGSGTLVTGSDIAGDIETEFVYGEQDPLLEAVAYNAWTNDVLTFGGSTAKTLSIIKGFTDKAIYEVFTGCYVNSWKLTIPESGIVTSTFSIMGMKRVGQSTLPTGTVTAAGNATQFTTLSAGAIKFDNAAITACATQLEVTFDNSAQIQKCINFDDNIDGIIENQMKISGTVTLAWDASSADLYEKQFNNTPVSLEWTLKDNLGNQYVLNFPQVTLSAPLPSGSSTDILSTQFTFTVQYEAPTLTRIP